MLTTGMASQPIFEPSAESVAGSQMTAFMKHCEAATGLTFYTAAAFHDYTVSRSDDFWKRFLIWSDLLCEGGKDPVCTGNICETATFFPDVKLSYVENLLRLSSESDGEKVALTCVHASGEVERITRNRLRSHVSVLAARLRGLGVGHGDRVVAVAFNRWEVVVGALAAAAIGATFSSASPDMGTVAILSRFTQLTPSVLLANTRPMGPLSGDGWIEQVISGLPTLKAIVSLDDQAIPEAGNIPVFFLSDILSDGAVPEGSPLSWERFGFNHPLFILFSSGTTGKPKCIVHGAGGTLLEHVKEHRLHGDLRPSDRLFFHTSTGWMMWNWQLSALACGAEIVLYDGPVTGPEALWRIVSDHDVTVFGTSPPYLKLCEDAGYSPRKQLPLRALRAMMSTGSILHDHQFDWVERNVGSLPLQSISGGTDIIGCFVLGNPNLPVRRGECQCSSLGFDVQSLGAVGAQDSRVGELVCRNPFPSRPVGFYGDPGRSLFHKAYFSQNPGMWTHGDLIEFTPSGGARLHGRSDSILNVGGIRIGPAEIYEIIKGFPEVNEAMVVEQATPGDAGATRLVLLIVPREPGNCDSKLKSDIRKRLVSQASRAHVPARIVEVTELPVTYSGKRSERAARDALNNARGMNTEALKNAGCLAEICRHVALEDESLQQPPGNAVLSGDDRLKAIWERILGFRGCDPDDSFFDLGGSSLTAIRLCQEINDELGFVIGPWILFYAPTLRSLGAVLDGKESSLSPIAPLTSGGSGRPVFLIPGMYGDVVELRALIGKLQAGRPLHGVRARGLAPGESAHTTVEEMASDYVAHLRQLQPVGPYTLIGYSFGGLVAYEMACKLREANEEIELLGLIDTDVHEDCLRPMERLRFMTMRPLRYLRLIAGAPLTFIPELLHRYGQTRSVRNIFVRETDVDAVMSPLLIRLAELNRRAFTSYRPRPFNGSMTVFRATSRWPRYCDPLPVWKRLATGDVLVTNIPGSHRELIQEPSVSFIANAIARLAP
jgi:acetoacetyl-CoA synthetase